MNYSDRLTSRYEIQQQLAKKAGRKTLLGRDLETQQLVVIKLLSFGIDFEWEALKLFEREAETLKALSHPAIPKYLDFFEFDTPYSKGFALVQSYVEGKSLETELKAGRTFSEVEVKQLAKSVLEILLYLHGQKPPVIHRDLKPSNILLGDRIEKIYLVDFGSVQTLASKEGGTMTVVGTYGYMPPEQFGDRAVPASDLYSLGTTLIYLVTGTHPADLPHKNGHIQFESVASLSPEFTRWLQWMTEPNLDRRLSSAREALAALEQPVNIVPTISQPFGSKIKLHQDANFVEILLPSKGFSPEIVSLSLFAIAWNSFLVFWLASALITAPMGMNLFFALFSLPFLGAGASMVWRILSALFGKVRITIDPQQISRSYEMLGFRFKQPRHQAPRQAIEKLAILSFGRVSRLTIWAGTRKYELGNDGSISPSEVDWLAQELSTWLGIPINKS
ncbi:serine/threonine protein kinase [Scytonema millei]|uniref:Serine/threonine protein kinase n=1 Tax=Scytonema millei VB511283 TaxID=1245923 RepID=A0A9X5E743_9CYAN|nr:serine/threonine-protein kinase [Scytonema millei]NHC36354.1 serine/threonine protein kinase [Scytonema millei VB511283]